MSQVMVHKNIDSIIKVFSTLGRDICIMFIGSPTTWGMPIKEAVVTELNNNLQAVTHEVVPAAKRRVVADLLGMSWAISRIHGTTRPVMPWWRRCSLVAGASAGNTRYSTVARVSGSARRTTL